MNLNVKARIWGLICSISPWKETSVDRIAIKQEQIASLDLRRSTIYESIVAIEQVEAQYLQEGIDATKEGKTLVAKRLCSQLANCRRDLRLQQTTAHMHTKRIHILSTDLGNLQLIQQAKALGMPTDGDMIENFTEAEVQVENIEALAALADGMDAGSDIGASDDEMAILAEFAAASKPEAVTETTPETVDIEADLADLPPVKKESIPEANPVC